MAGHKFQPMACLMFQNQKSLSHSLGQSVTRSPIELFWTAKNKDYLIGNSGKIGKIFFLFHIDCKNEVVITFGDHAMTPTFNSISNEDLYRNTL